MQRYVEVTMVVSSIEGVTNALLASAGIKADRDILPKMLEMYEMVLNHKAYLPDVFDKFSKNRSAWGQESVGSALSEVAQWSET